MPNSSYRDPITIQRLKPSETPNDLGEPAVEDEANWEDVFPCFAEVITKGQREFIKAGIMDADVSHLVRVPRSNETTSLDSNMRILLLATGEKLHIESSYRRDATNREIEILCRN